MKNLIIVGNGFDLAHKLKTNYSDFTSDLKNNPDKYDIKPNHQNHMLHSLLRDNHNLWSDIETTYFDIISNFKEKKYLQVRYTNVHTYGSTKELNDDFEKIKEWLREYLLDVEKKFSPIKNYQDFFAEFNNKETVVLNFNYTETVSHYLQDKKIELIHIHGELKNEANPIIFGFAADDENSKKLLIENDNNYVRNIKKFNYLFTQNESILKKTSCLRRI